MGIAKVVLPCMPDPREGLDETMFGVFEPSGSESDSVVP